LMSLSSQARGLTCCHASICRHDVCHMVNNIQQQQQLPTMVQHTVRLSH
jgi:hypothetical protein